MNKFASYEQILKKDGYFIAHFFGNSMKPFFNDKRDLVLIKNAENKPVSYTHLTLPTT